MNAIRRTLFLAMTVTLAAVAALTIALAPAAAAEVKYIVNKEPITTYDIQRRAALLRLMQQGAGGAAQQMIDQVLRAQEMRRLGINVSNSQVTMAYERFANSNNMSTRQMDGILAQSGVTKEHFREFIRSQMGWGQAVSQRASSAGQSAKDAIREMMTDGKKPSATEYILQQVILVVPDRERRQILGRRKREAQTLKAQMSGCDNSREVAKTMLDVTVRDLGRILEPELPPDWEKQVKATQAGGATAARETDRGVEFILVCSTRTASDDRVAQLLYQKQQAESGANQETELSEKYTAELREKAQIIER
jgi:peptidyl-prolyl cis-trans isomerase SurA